MSTLSLKTSKKELKCDNYETPDNALDCLLPYIPRPYKYTIVWDCACGNGRIVDFFSKWFLTFGTDINGIVPINFLDETKWDTDFDVIVTNPPFSLKTEFVQRAAEYDKPFAFLMNITALESAKRHTIYQRCNMQLLLPDKRINYIRDGKQTKSAWFYSAWFLFRFDLPRDINYVKVH